MVSKKRGQITPGLGNRLRQIREKEGMTRDAVAESAGISVRHLAAVELEQKSASVDTLYHLIRTLGVSADTVFYPELDEDDGDLELIHRLAGTCPPAKRKFLIQLIRLLLNSEFEI